MTEREHILEMVSLHLYRELDFNCDFYISNNERLDTLLYRYLNKYPNYKNYDTSRLKKAIVKNVYNRFLSDRSYKQLNKENIESQNIIIKYIEGFF